MGLVPHLLKMLSGGVFRDLNKFQRRRATYGRFLKNRFSYSTLFANRNSISRYYAEKMVRGFVLRSLVSEVGWNK